MIRMSRRDGRLRCTGALVADLPNDDAGWGQVSRAARAAGLAIPIVEPETDDYLFLPARSEAEAALAWKGCTDTQWAALRRAHAALVRLGELVIEEPALLPVEASAPAEPQAPRLRLELVTEEQAIAIAAVMAAARVGEPVEWFKLGVCVLVLEGRDAALALDGLPEKTFMRLKTVSESKARDQALKWAAEVVR